MVAPPCPLCHGATRFAGHKPYCPNCGWNRGAALANLRSGMSALPIGTVFAAGDWVIAAIVALLLFLPYTMWRSQVRECDLLENGEVALAKVVRQWKSDKSSSSSEYEFQDSQGETRKGTALDYTEQLFEGMPLAVFYDREHPQRQIAGCGTLHEVVT